MKVCTLVKGFSLLALIPYKKLDSGLRVSRYALVVFQGDPSYTGLRSFCCSFLLLGAACFGNIMRFLILFFDIFRVKRAWTCFDFAHNAKKNIF
jgi:hypothetical protein